MSTFRTIDAAALPPHLDSTQAEDKWKARWDELGVYRYDPTRTREETFVVDTPPPTVSGSLHMGHVFSYTHTDVIVRFQRMTGKNIFYPMGWDDNGLPTERRVQNFFHVRVDAKKPYEKGLEIAPANDEQAKKEPPRLVSRPNFVELCQRVTVEDEKVFMGLWKRLGLSVDWSQEYATIDERCRKLAQYSFLDLYGKGLIYNVDAPTMWDVDFQTAVAQAEVEDRPMAGAFHDIAFGIEGTNEHFVIATTRPELLPACVAVTAHPDDPRYQHLFGKRAVTPIFHVPVPIFPSPLVDKEKGTGILMVCTFGDQTDVQWWREQKLPLRQILGRNGRLVPLTFGTPGWESNDAAKANAAYAGIVGKGAKQAGKAIVELLKSPDSASAPSAGAPLQGTPKNIERPVKFYEKGDQPLEFISTRQWFVRLLDQKSALLEKGEQIQWHPDHMKTRYRNWTEGLGLDWCISRQRYFGVPFPVWYRLDDKGIPDYANPILAAAETLPVDPATDAPPGYTEAQRGQPGGFEGELDVYDTWFTSSLTPQIGSKWVIDKDRHARLFPADIRPQSHEIIRTWAFYTIAKAMLHENKIPWKNVVISGWILDPDRKKMSKSRGNVVTPMHLLDNYSADGVRYWAANARLGTDTAFDEKVFKVGRRLVTKIYNAGKYVLSQPGEVHPVTSELDRGFLVKLASVVEQATKDLEGFDYASALKETEAFFWGYFTDSYLELVKGRIRGEFGASKEATGSAVATLRIGLSILLRMFAPVVPYVTEEVWSWIFAEETKQPSIHAAKWPTVAELAIAAPKHPEALDYGKACMFAINKKKSESGASTGRVVVSLTLAMNQKTRDVIESIRHDVMGATRTQALTIETKAEVEDGAFEVVAVELAPPAPTATEAAPEAG
ncbi:MAG: valine--tRNA ligase [Polyangiaceae bacterium]